MELCATMSVEDGFIDVWKIVLILYKSNEEV